MRLAHLPAVFMRGGTSNAVVFRAEDLPADKAEWDDIFLQVMGSPDPNGRQLDGMGGGISSLSKVCIVGPSSRDDADVDYTFAQIGVDKADVDYTANCGNMSSAIGPFAVDQGLVPTPPDGETVVRIHNTNTSKIIHARFPVAGGQLAVDGDMAIDGVAGTAAPIRLEFRDPGGARTGKLLPTGKPVDTLEVKGVGRIDVSMVDAANPCAFVRAADVGKIGNESPEELENDQDFMTRMEAIRQAASVAMGIGTDLAHAEKLMSVPKMAMIAKPATNKTLSGAVVDQSEFDICIRMISVGRPHRAVPVTGATCLAVASRIPGTLAHAIVGNSSEPVRIAHPSGSVVVDAKVSTDDNGTIRAEYGAVFRTARKLFSGEVYYRSPK